MPPAPKARRQAADIRHILGRGAVQLKLKIGAVDDPLEREADRVADQVMRMPDADVAPAISVHRSPLASQRLCDECAEELQPKRKSAAERTVQRVCTQCEAEQALRCQPNEDQEEPEVKGQVEGRAPEVDPTTQGRFDTSQRGGLPLPESARAFFEARIGRDLSEVRVHTDEQAAASAQALGARAYTIGRNIVFGQNEFAPATTGGRRLIAHELAHVAQQAAGSDSVPVLRRAASVQRQGNDTEAEQAGAGAPSGPDLEARALPGGDAVATLDQAIGYLDNPLARMLPGFARPAALDVLTDQVRPFLLALEDSTRNPAGYLDGVMEFLKPRVAQVSAYADSIGKDAITFSPVPEGHWAATRFYLGQYLSNLGSNWQQVVLDTIWDQLWPIPGAWGDVVAIWDRIGLWWDHLTSLEFSAAIDDVLAIIQLFFQMLGHFYLWFFLACAGLGFLGGAFPASIFGTIAGAVLGAGVGAPAGTTAGVIAGGIAGAGAGAAFAGSIGLGLLGAAAASEAALIGKAGYDLIFRDDTAEAQDADHRQIAESAITLGIYAALYILGMAASRVASYLARAVRGSLTPRVAPPGGGGGAGSGGASPAEVAARRGSFRVVQGEGAAPVPEGQPVAMEATTGRPIYEASPVPRMEPVPLEVVPEPVVVPEAAPAAPAPGRPPAGAPMVTVASGEQGEEAAQTGPGAAPVAVVDPDNPKESEDLPAAFFYHGAEETVADTLAAGVRIEAIGHGEFGAGFYTFIDEVPAIEAASIYVRNDYGPDYDWGVVAFEVPPSVLMTFLGASDLAALHGGADSRILIFPDKRTQVNVVYPDWVGFGPDGGPIEALMDWGEFVEENKQLDPNKRVDWPYDLIIGPLKGKLPGFKSVDQWVFGTYGVEMFNTPEVKREVTARSST